MIRVKNLYSVVWYLFLFIFHVLQSENRGTIWRNRYLGFCRFFRCRFSVSKTFYMADKKTWRMRRRRFILSCGCLVMMLDHVIKESEMTYFQSKRFREFDAFSQTNLSYFWLCFFFQWIFSSTKQRSVQHACEPFVLIIISSSTMFSISSD